MKLHDRIAVIVSKMLSDSLIKSVLVTNYIIGFHVFSVFMIVLDFLNLVQLQLKSQFV